MLTEQYTPNLLWSTKFLLLDSEGQPLDLTGVTFRMQIRATVNSSEILAIASVEIVEITSTYNQQEVTGNGIEISLTAEDTLHIYQSSKNAVADLELSYPSGKIIPEILKLSFEPKLTITRDF